MNNAALSARIESVYSTLLSSGEPLTLVRIQESLGWRHTPVWEIEQLQAQGRVTRVVNTPGVHCVDGRYKAK